MRKLYPEEIRLVAQVVMTAAPHPMISFKRTEHWIIVDELPNNMKFEAVVLPKKLQLSACWLINTKVSPMLRRHIKKQGEKAKVERMKVDRVQYRPDEGTVTVYRMLTLTNKTDVLQIGSQTAEFI
jgi:hypothetical protein